jgi:hypothetical protein
MLQEIKQLFNVYEIRSMGDLAGPSIEMAIKPGFPVICVDFGEMVEIYRSTDPDDVARLDASDPKFIPTLCETLDYFQVPRKAVDSYPNHLPRLMKELEDEENQLP